jgi:hypothetical protein
MWPPHGAMRLTAAWRDACDRCMARCVWRRQVNSLASPKRDVYEFGVFTGSRLVEFAHTFAGFGNMWGFDSFIGTHPPAPPPHPLHPPHHPHPHARDPYPPPT